jgi:site-specific DNA-methyltransferase (adenine-specific)
MLDIEKIKNTIICGDCLKVMKDIPDNSIDLVLTDVPYNTGMSQKTSNGSTWLSHFFDDDYTEESYQNLVDSSCKEFWRLLKDDRYIYIYIYINWKEYPRWFYALKKVGFIIKACIVWDKVIHGLGSQYKYTHEFIIFAEKGNPPIKQPNELGKYYKDIWRIQRINYSDKQHDTQKVIGIVELPILHATKENDIILDPFLGSGTTAVACQNLKRNFIGIEISEKYCEIAKQRLRQQVLL